jgi:hypothetical protein
MPTVAEEAFHESRRSSEGDHYKMKLAIEHPRTPLRCLHFDADGKKKIPQNSQSETPAYDPWRALKELKPEDPQTELNHA